MKKRVVTKEVFFSFVKKTTPLINTFGPDSQHASPFDLR